MNPACGRGRSGVLGRITRYTSTHMTLLLSTYYREPGTPNLPNRWSISRTYQEDRSRLETSVIAGSLHVLDSYMTHTL